MAEFLVMSWRELPSLVTARDGDDVAKVPLPARLQEAIDEAATRLGETGSEAYLAGWQRGPWTAREGDPTTVAAAVAAELEHRWSAEAVASYLDGLGPSRQGG
ncbi:MAG: virulence factor [Actinomycetota bacterium]|nr:virulence factor [Actinomycetota bacterium]